MSASQNIDNSFLRQEAIGFDVNGQNDGVSKTFFVVFFTMTTNLLFKVWL